MFLDSKVYISGRIDHKEDELPKLLVEDLVPLVKNAEGVLVFTVTGQDDIDFRNLKRADIRISRKTQIIIYLEEIKKFLLDKRFKVNENSLNLLRTKTGLRKYCFGISR